jgi:hypothetical protein
MPAPAAPLQVVAAFEINDLANSVYEHNFGRGIVRQVRGGCGAQPHFGFGVRRTAPPGGLGCGARVQLSPAALVSARAGGPGLAR